MDDESSVYADTVNLLLAQIAQEQGLVFPRQVEEAQQEQDFDRARGVSPVRTLGVILVEKGYLTNTQLVSLLHQLRDRARDPEDDQSRQNTLLGNLLLRRRSVSPPQLAECLRVQAEARDRDAPVIPRLGELLVERGYAPVGVVSEALAVQAEARSGSDRHRVS